MLENIGKLDVFIGLAITGISSGLGMGLGMTIGQYFASKHIIRRSEKLVRRIKKAIKK